MMYEPECEVSFTSSSSLESSSQQINKINILNDDKLLKLLNDNLNENEKELCKKSFEIYKLYKNNKNEFIIDFDDIYKWIGFTQKTHAKRLLTNKFTVNNNFIIISRSGDNSRGPKSEQILLTINTFKKFCMIAATEKSIQIYDYYIKMEETIQQYLEEKLIENNTIIENKDKEIEDLKKKC